MRIGKIYHGEKTKKDKITIIELKEEQIPPIRYTPDIDFDDEKSVHKYVRSLKTYIRGSMEYSKLMRFLKCHMEMNKCFFLKKVWQYKGSKISMEIHHTGFTMEDIIDTVLRKRYKEGEDYNASYIAREIMLLHYRGMIGLTSLCATCHELIHAEGSQLFIPLQDCGFGDMNLFYEEYKPYMNKALAKKYETYRLMSETVDNIENIIPDYLDVNIIYYEQEHIKIPNMKTILELIAA